MNDRENQKKKNKSIHTIASNPNLFLNTYFAVVLECLFSFSATERREEEKMCRVTITIMSPIPSVIEKKAATSTFHPFPKCQVKVGILSGKEIQTNKQMLFFFVCFVFKRMKTKETSKKTRKLLKKVLFILPFHRK